MTETGTHTHKDAICMSSTDYEPGYTRVSPPPRKTNGTVISANGLNMMQIERFRLSAESLVCITRITVDEPFDMLIESASSKHQIGFITTITGSAQYDADSVTQQLTEATTISFQQSPHGFRLRILPGAPFCAVGIYTSARDMECHLKSPPPTTLQNLVVSQSTTLVHYPTTSNMRVVGDLMAASGQTEGLRDTRLRGLALTLLAMQADAIAGQEDETAAASPPASEQDQLQYAFDRLMADLQSPPGLDTLAAETGLSGPDLNAGLRQCFGGTAAELTRVARLERAAVLLRHTDLSIKQISWDMGYRHVSNFNRAFTARFGQPPAAYAQSAQRHRNAVSSG